MQQTKTFTNNYRLITIFCFLSFGIIVALVTSFINYSSNFKNIERSLQEMSSSEAEFKQQLLADYISKFELLLSAIARNDLTRRYITSESETDRKSLIELFYALSYENTDVMQLRFIDLSGQERIRIDRNKSNPLPLVVPDNQLQDKSQRHYFRQSLALPANLFWHSNVDLNIERGAIEVPIKPTFRLATPLFADQQLRGILIVNLLFENTLEVLANSSNFDIYLIDREGEVLHHPEPGGSWSRYLDHGQNAFALFPVDADSLLTSDVYHGTHLSSYDFGTLFRNDDQVRLVFVPKAAVIEQMQSTNIFSALLIGLAVIVVSIPLSWGISLIPSRLQSQLSHAYEASRKDAEIIDKYVMISKTDLQGVITDVSSNLTKTSGYSAHELIGKHHSVLGHPDTPGELYKELWETILRGDVWEGDIRERDKDGNDFWVHTLISPEFTTDNEIEGFTAISQNITDKILIEKMSKIDNLTGLYNRNRLDEVLAIEMARFDRFNSPFSIIIIDIDHFKQVNDSHGHQAGDRVLMQLASILKLNSRNTDCICRWGGEEFIVVASGLTLNESVSFAEKFRQQVNDFEFPAIGSLTISCGVAEYRGEESSEQLLSRADSALYLAKNSGRNRVISDTPTNSEHSPA